MFKDVMLELTYRCNLRCSFCYLAPDGRLNRRGGELDAGDWSRIISRFKAGTRFYLSGGEPLMRRDIFEIIGFIKKSGSSFGLNTNGTLLNAAKAARLATLKPDYVIFSLHGSEAVHDRLTGMKGSWRALMDNMKRFVSLSDHSTEVIVNCVINRGNAGELAKVYRAGRDAGADRVVFEHLQFLKPEEAAVTSTMLRSGGIITPLLENYGADAAVINRQLAAISRMDPHGPDGRSVHFETRPLMGVKQLELYYNDVISPVGGCARVMDTLNVEPDGSIRLCVLYGLKAGNALTADLKKVLSLKKKHIGSDLPSGCARCCHRFQLFRYF